MKFTKLLKSRKSIRTYTGKPADKKQVKKIIEAAELAPVARGLYENYQLTIINDPKLLKEIDQEAAMMFSDLESHPLYGVPTLILVSAKKQDEMAYASGLLPTTWFWLLKTRAWGLATSLARQLLCPLTQKQL